MSNIFGGGATQRLTPRLGAALVLTTIGGVMALNALPDAAGSTKTWTIACLVLAWVAGGAAVLTSGGGASGGSLGGAIEGPKPWRGWT